MSEYRKSNKRVTPLEQTSTDDLYNDLPDDVVDILMKTHPLMSKDNAKLKDKKSSVVVREDVDEVKEARMQRVGTELNQIKNAPQQEGDPTKYVSRRGKGDVMEEELGSSRRNRSTTNASEKEDFVNVMPSRKKASLDATSQTATPPKKRKPAGSQSVVEESFSQVSKVPKAKFEPINFEERAKQEHLDHLYQEEDEYEEDGLFSGRGKLVAVLGLVGCVLICFLLFKTTNLGNQLEEAKQAIASTDELNIKYEALQIERLALEEQVLALQTQMNGGGSSDIEGDSGFSEVDGETTYTVVQGDNLWNIAQKVYGDGSQYSKILTANNMSENDAIRVGQKLTIPR